MITDPELLAQIPGEPFLMDEFVHQLLDYIELGELGEARGLLEWFMDGCVC